MAQEIQTECRPCESTDEPIGPLVNDVTAYAPPIMEIGFIDEADDGRSDTSETSLSEEVPQDVAILTTKTTDEDNQLVPHCGLLDSGQESENSSDATNHIPIKSDTSVPSPQVVPSSPPKISEVGTCFENGVCDDTSNDGQQKTLKDQVHIEDRAETDPLLKANDENGGKNGTLIFPVFETLEESMEALKASVQDGSAIGSFERLPKRRDTLEMDVAKLPDNTPKNRYKDVLPYDESRVPLSECETGDYINASFVEMKVPETTNTYIASQGPLPHTCDEFWEMVWEHKCSIIVMVTPLKERNRVKCHQYWPDVGETSTSAGIQIACFGETTTPAGITRELLLINEKKNQERHVIQMQHVTWPDHGVPEDATDFLEFIQQLREWRKLLPGQVVVHCSAGVGRTGVLILMETVMCKIEAEEPVWPLELVQKMREQRVMMVQTIGQYKFICEAVLKLYNDHKAKQS